jgi:hypothetical protein
MPLGIIFAIIVSIMPPPFLGGVVLLRIKGKDKKREEIKGWLT